MNGSNDVYSFCSDRRLFTPSQAEVLTGDGDLREALSTSPCLLAIPAFDRIAGSYNRHLNSYRGICFRQ
jgi:hypothetical protein